MTEKSVRQQFADTMLAVGQEDPELVVMVGDISHGILQPFAKACPGRYYNIGILEPTIVSMGAGLARAGLFPVLHTIAPFLIERAFEQIKLDFCYHQLAGNLVTVGSAFDYAYLGCSHHCYGDFALLKTLQDVEITYPSSAVEFDALFRQSYRNPRVSVHRVPAVSHGVAFRGDQLQLGKAIKVTDGDNLTLIATGPQLRTALGAREALLGAGWRAEIIYVHTIRPLDEELVLASAAKTKHVVVIEEHLRSGGLGDDVLRLISRLAGVRYVSASIPDSFVRGYGSYEDHCEALGLTPNGVVELVKSRFNE